MRLRCQYYPVRGASCNPLYLDEKTSNHALNGKSDLDEKSRYSRSHHLTHTSEIDSATP